jgi:hypothetical protein
MWQPSAPTRYFCDATRAARVRPGELHHRLDVLGSPGGGRMGSAGLTGCAPDELGGPEAIWRLTIGARTLPEDFALRGGEFVPVLIRPWAKPPVSELGRPPGPREPSP